MGARSASVMAALVCSRGRRDLQNGARLEIEGIFEAVQLGDAAPARRIVGGDVGDAGDRLALANDVGLGAIGTLRIELRDHLRERLVFLDLQRQRRPQRYPERAEESE